MVFLTSGSNNTVTPKQLRVHSVKNYYQSIMNFTVCPFSLLLEPFGASEDFATFY